MGMEKISEGDSPVIYEMNHELFRGQITYEEEYIAHVCSLGWGFIAKVNGCAAGYVLFENVYVSTIKKSGMTIMSIGVRKPYRNNGIGRKLLGRVFDQVKCDIYLHVRVSNYEAINLYKSEGFIIINTIKKFYNTETLVDDAHCMVRFHNISDLL